jgi:hypothetical protein
LRSRSNLASYQLLSWRNWLRDPDVLIPTQMAAAFGVSKSTAKSWYYAGIVLG